MKKFILLFFVITIIACSKSEVETANVQTYNSYIALKIGKTLTYKLDSFVLIKSATEFDTTRYLAKDSIESTYNDANGNLCYRVYRYLTDTGKQNPWKYNTTVAYVVKQNSLETVIDNLKFVSLSNPISANFDWNGNAFINTTSLSPFEYYDSWKYRYENINQTYNTKKGIIDSTITVAHVDYAQPQVFDPRDNFAQKRFSKEVYGKNIGLIYKEILCYTWQGNGQRFEDYSFGLRMNLIDYK